MKRDHWTNDEVIFFLEGFRREGFGDWNNSLELAINQFFDFQRPAEDYAVMAYIPETQEIVGIGPPLPR